MENCLQAMTLISKKKRFYFCNRLFIYFTIIKIFYPFWILIFFQFTGKDLKCLFSLLLYFSRNEGTDDNLYLNIYVLTSFKEMLWPIQFIKGACPGFKRPTQVTSDSAEKRFKYEKEKRSERIFNAKWCEGRP